ncbi:MAG TPA: hypothetical protein VGL81_28715 [Polyangiaceae bacterium]|jgi:hypothetical protein
MTCGCRQARHNGENASPVSGTHATRRWWIDLSTGRSSARVELPRLVAVRVHGVDMVPLEVLWAASHLGGSPMSLRFDFVADDGFRIASKQPAGIDGSDLRTGYVCVVTRDLVWQPVPERPCFWRVKAVARVVATRKGA